MRDPEKYTWLPPDPPIQWREELNRMIAVWGCVLAVLLDLFDRFERRYAVDLYVAGGIPSQRWISWGYIDRKDFWQSWRYLAIKLPVWSYEYRIQCDDYAMGQLMLVWVSRQGWRRVYAFD